MSRTICAEQPRADFKRRARLIAKMNMCALRTPGFAAQQTDVPVWPGISLSSGAKVCSCRTMVVAVAPALMQLRMAPVSPRALGWLHCAGSALPRGRHFAQSHSQVARALLYSAPPTSHCALGWLHCAGAHFHAGGTLPNRTRRLRAPLRRCRLRGLRPLC